MSTPEKTVHDVLNARRSKLAVISLVISLIPIVGLFGLFLAVIALIRIGRSGGELRGTGFAIGGLVASFLVTTGTLMVAAIALPGIVKARDAANSVKHMKEIQTACLQYANSPEGHGAFPDDPRALYPKYLPDVTVFVNPKYRSEPVGYVYLSGVDPKDSVSILLYESTPTSKTVKELWFCHPDGNCEVQPATAVSLKVLETTARYEKSSKPCKEIKLDRTVSVTTP